MGLIALSLFLIQRGESALYFDFDFDLTSTLLCKSKSLKILIGPSLSPIHWAGSALYHFNYSDHSSHNSPKSPFGLKMGKC